MVSSMGMLFLRYLRLLWKESVTNEGDRPREGRLSAVEPAGLVVVYPFAQAPTSTRPTHTHEDRQRWDLVMESGGRREGSHCRDGWLTKGREMG
jgi:hypothetical protein